MERLDKIISRAFSLTRKEAKKVIKNGEVCVGAVAVLDPESKAEPESVRFRGKTAVYKEHLYIMLNKPAGVISASEGKGEKTVVDLVPPQLQRKGLFPAGRLDKDTVGFVLITDDGAFAHNILNPKKHVEKTYFVQTDKPIERSLVKTFAQGVELFDGTLCMSAVLEIESENSCVVKIKEGKYHQIKRMFRANGLQVVYLKRTAIGAVPLDQALAEGACRELTDAELKQLIEK